ncbi:MAG: tol-pal system protein YbgF [Nitrosomonas sp.]|nr:tol-pal system protein YbgF [Nitrosomonas sp.]MDP1951248.1 tol-pal system protein YbgF [Nitrosomonas sp.]
MFIRVSILLFLIGCNVSVSQAGLFGDSKAREQVGTLRSQVDEMEARIEKMEETLKNQALLELYTQVETLGSEFGELRGQIEILNNQNELLQKRQRDFYIDLDNRLRRIEDPNAPPVLESSDLSTGSETSSASIDSRSPPQQKLVQEPMPITNVEPAGAAEKSAYEAAFKLFKNGDYLGSISQFETFLSNYPASSLAPGAAYWVGNAHYALRDFLGAITAQNKLISIYPNSAKVPDALLNIASSQHEMADSAAAKATLEDLIARYPHSDVAEKAKHRLANLR